MIGDKELENEGAAEKVSKVKEVAEDAVEGVKNMLHKDDAK